MSPLERCFAIPALKTAALKDCLDPLGRVFEGEVATGVFVDISVHHNGPPHVAAMAERSLVSRMVTLGCTPPQDRRGPDLSVAADQAAKTVGLR